MKLGIQFQEEKEEVLRYNRIVKPALIKSINCHKRAFFEEIRRDNPDVFIIYRHAENVGGWQENPVAAAWNLLDVIISEIAIPEDRENYILDLIDGIEGENEFIFSGNTSLFDRADQTMATFATLVATKLGKKAIILNSSKGHFAEELVNLFPLTWQTLAAYDGYVGFHEYDFPTMDAIGGNWLCCKYRRAMPPIRTKYGPIPAIITECGLDDGNRHGWKSCGGNIWESFESYLGDHSLGWYNDRLNEDDYVLGATIFVCCGQGWGDFDIAGFAFPERIAQFPSVEIPSPSSSPSPEPPEEPEMGDLSEIKVYKLVDEKPVKLETLAEKEALVYGKYGVAFTRADVVAGERVYRLTELWEKTGVVALITQVLNQDGNPMANVDVALYWPDAPSPPDPPTPVYPHDWHPNFVHGLTNVNGDVGPGMGRGAYHGVGEGGPHAVWIRDLAIPSDICEKLGMLAGTFHDHLDQKFQYMVVGGEPEPPPPEGDKMFRLVESDFVVGDRNQIVVLVEGEKNFYDVRASLAVKGTNIDMGPFEPKNLTRFELDASYNPGQGETKRVFLVTLEKPDGTLLVEKPFECLYNTGVKGIWTLLVEWGTGEGPSPSPSPSPPPSGRIRVNLTITGTIEVE